MNNTETIVFRKEQIDAIEQTIKCFQHGRRMLWNAKMRFGKTLCAIEVAHRMGYRRTLVITHRPAVRGEWQESLNKLKLDNWIYGSRLKLQTEAQQGNDSIINRNFEQLETEAANNPSIHYIYFASMQDMRGSRRVNQQKGIDKNDNVFSAKWDFVIIDEAHEGVVSRLGNEVINELQKRRSLRTLYLSGTPYNIQAMFDTNDVYHWDYCMEQKAKAYYPTQHPGEHNPYASLPQLNMLTYNLTNKFRAYRNADGSFNFAEFWRTQEVVAADNQPATSQFVHEGDVRKFIKMLATDSEMKFAPYSKTGLSANISHALWYLPGVAAAHCLADILTEQTPDNPFRNHTIVNVAGDGDTASVKNDMAELARYEQNALARVKSAIASTDNTITLSCGRLTMGITIPEWSAVFMLAGAAETGGMRYFQTIFRCQSPYSGKENCYAIDFSPRRTLTVIDQYINNNVSTSSQEERLEKLTEFLHYCPVIEVSNNKHTRLDTETFIKSVNSAYSQSLIRNGFRDDCLYGNLDNLKQNDIKLFDEVAEAIFRGITAERRLNREQLQGKPSTKSKRQKATNKEATADSKELAPNEQAALDSLKAARRRMTPRQRAIAVLTQISTRFPMMIYGTVDKIEGLTLQSFINGIDNDSWNEFMPRGITMRLFNRIKHFYREDVFVATAKVIVERVRHADSLPPMERVAEIADILSDFCYPDRETVLTPWATVNRQLSDTLGGYCFYNQQFDHTTTPRYVYRGDATDRTFANPKARILDIASKTGLYSLYAAYSIFKLRSTQSQGLFDLFSDQESDELWQEVVAENIFAVCRTRMAQLITRRTLLGFHNEAKANISYVPDLTAQVVVYKNTLVRNLNNAQDFWQLGNSQQSTNRQQKDMKFDAIIGNPPYQVNIGEQKDNYGIPLYNQFVEVARAMKPNFITMIMPSRWFTGGRGLDHFRTSMLTDRRMRAIFDYVDSKDCFPTVDISGGVGYFLWDANHNADCTFTNTLHGKSLTRQRQLDEFPVFVRNNEALTLINKVLATSTNTLSSMVSGQTPFGFVSTYRGTADPAVDADAIALKSSGAISHVLRADIKKNQQWVDMYKVIFSKATCEHAGTPDRSGKYRVLSSATILPPGTICTQSYLVGGAFSTQDEAENMLTYLRTRFARFLMLQTITSQDLSPDKFMFVPTQDFTNNGDIKWQEATQSVETDTESNTDFVDHQLYAKYSITPEEVAMIESIIKPM